MKTISKMDIFPMSDLHCMLDNDEEEEFKEEYQILTSFFVPLDVPEHNSTGFLVKQWTCNHYLWHIEEVTDSVMDFVEKRKDAEGGIDDYWTYNGFPALHFAVMANFYAVIEYLLDNGANL